MITLFLTNGLVLGGTYAILAAGFNLIFGVARLMNFSHTGLYMISAFVMYELATNLSLPLLLVIPLSILAPVVVAMVFYRFCIDRIKEHEFLVVILTVALVLIMQESFLFSYGGNPLGVEVFFPGYLEIMGSRTSYQHLVSLLVCALVLVGLGVLLRKTKLGNAIRAVSQDTDVANLMGMNVARIQLFTVAISAGLAGVAAVVVVPLFSIEPYMWLNPLIIVLASVVLGGMGSIKGCIIGAFLLAFMEVAVAAFIPGGGYLKGVASLSAMVIVLIVRPEGLFGIIFEEERL